MPTLQSGAPVSYATVRTVAEGRVFVVRETPQAGPTRPRLLDRVRLALRARHGSRRTTTMIYTHVLNRGPAGVRSPADRMLAP